MNIQFKKLLVGALSVGVLALSAIVVPTANVSAALPAECVTDANSKACADAKAAAGCKDANSIQGGIDCASGGNTTQLFGSSSIFTNIVNTLLFVIGAISVIMLIYGGIRYTLSAGNAAQVTSAKNTIMYAIVGLIVAFLAFALVNWVLGSLMPAATPEA